MDDPNKSTASLLGQTHAFYACYMLHSLRLNRKNYCYIGSTPVPVRRIRQHNGIIKGGAKKTVKNRPCELGHPVGSRSLWGLDPSSMP
jgi:predicted GIY-YIG superfamily endonuclease